MPLITKRMGDSCKYYTVNRGLSGAQPGVPATRAGMCHVFCASIAAIRGVFGPRAKEIMDHNWNYTDQVTVIQMSDAVTG